MTEDAAPLSAEDGMTPQAVAEYAVWYARKVKGPAPRVAAALLEEFPCLREPLEAAIRSGSPTDAALPCQYCGSVNGETPPGHHVDPMTGETLRAAIAGACDLIDPRLSEVDWDQVAAVFDEPAIERVIATAYGDIPPHDDDAYAAAWEDAFNALRAASGSPEPVLEPHPGVNHDFRMDCRLCGEDGHLFVAFITDGDVVRIEPRPAVSDPIP